MESDGNPRSVRAQLEAALVQKCWKDQLFKSEIVYDPKGVIEEHIGRQLPSDLKIFIHEETPMTLHLTLPAILPGITELSDEQLERISAGSEVVFGAFMTVTPASFVAGGVAAGRSGGW